MMYIFSMMIAVLAGSLSLGEERASGTHSWQLTLTVSARRQWLIKLAMAMSTSMVCAVGLPVLVVVAVGYVRGTPFIDLHDSMVWLLLLLLTFGSFWCACAVNGTWPAVAWLFPATGAVFFASGSGNWAGQQLAQTTGTLREIVVSQRHLDPEALLVPFAVAAAILLVVPASILAIVQSYRMFRTQPKDNTWGIIRSVLTLAFVALLCSLSVAASGIGRDVLPALPGAVTWRPYYETHTAIERLQSNMPKQGAADPLQFNDEDLDRAGPMTALTRRWLHGSRITVTPRPAGAERLAMIHHGAIIIHLASGLECTIDHVRVAGQRITLSRPSCLPTQP